jgi:pimeloyl-ACP methyl ester carboxylesterase
MIKKILFSLLVLALAMIVLALVIGFAADTNKLDMEAKYGNSPVLRTQASGMRYRDDGNPNGPVLLLLHGANSSLQTWEPMVAALADQFRLVSFDQHGHGLTGAQAEHDYSAQTRVLAGVEVLDELGIERAIWIGNSMGGGVAWRAALLATDRVSGLVLIDPSGAQTDEPIKPYIGARIARTWIGQKILPMITPRFLVAQSLRQSVANPEVMTEAMIDRYWEMVRYPGNRASMAAAMAQTRESKLWGKIDSINVPTLILWGEQDQVIPVSHGAAFAERINNSELINYPNAGHLPMEEIPQTVAADVRAWFNRAYPDY